MQAFSRGEAVTREEVRDYGMNDVEDVRISDVNQVRVRTKLTIIRNKWKIKGEKMQMVYNY